MSKPPFGICLEGFISSALLGPIAILAHEFLGHWIPARILGAKDLTMGYTRVESKTIENWPNNKQIPVHSGGPLVSNGLVLLGLILLNSKNTFLKLSGWGLTLTAYRGLTIPVRQFLRETPPNNVVTDETLLANCFHFSKYVFSAPQALLSLWFLVSGYQLLPAKKKVVLSATILGNIIGVTIYIKVFGPLIWPNQVKEVI